MHQIKICFLILFLCFSQAALAVSWYQVEVIIFDRLYPNLDGEQWQNKEFKIRDNMVELQPLTPDQSLIPYMVLSKSRNRLGGIYQILRLSSDYRPLIHLSWQQPATEQRQSRYVHLQRFDGEATVPVTNIAGEPDFIESSIQPNQILDGSIRIRSGFHLHADIDLSYFKKLPPENKIIRTNKNLFAGIPDKTIIKLKETRKMKLNEIHYFDHPMYGVILQASRL